MEITTEITIPQILRVLTNDFNFNIDTDHSSGSHTITQPYVDDENAFIVWMMLEILNNRYGIYTDANNGIIFVGGISRSEDRFTINDMRMKYIKTLENNN